MIFRQLFDAESSTYTYVLGDEATREAVIIDSVKPHVDEYLKLLEALDLKLKYVLDTHVHAVHITGAGELRAATGAPTIQHENTRAECVSRKVRNGDTLPFGNAEIRVIHTPGHTPCSASFLVDDKVFTGDALLIDACGRTDFQNGSAEELGCGDGQTFYTASRHACVPGARLQRTPGLHHRPRNRAQPAL